MKTLGIVLALSAVTSGIEWSNLYMKWSIQSLDPSRLNSFFEIPRTLKDAISQDWVEVTGLNSLGLTMYCYPNDGQFCVLFDGYGYIAGFQAGILRSDVDPTGNIYKTSKFDVYQNKTIFEKNYVTSTIYTVNPETLLAGGRSEWNNLTGTKGVWIGTTDGYVEIPRKVKDLDSVWTEEACISEMGTHYYYDMSTSMDCEDFYPWFLLYQNGELSGVGLQSFGSCTVKKRSWCEHIPVAGIKLALPIIPQCMIDWAGDYGVISMHVYFTSKPWDYTC